MPGLLRWTVSQGKLMLEWKDKALTRLPFSWLLDHQKSNWHASTNQKINPASLLREDWVETHRIMNVTVDKEGQEMTVHWSEGKPSSSFSLRDLRHRTTLHSRWGLPARQPWKVLREALPTSSAALPAGESAKRILSDLAIHGFHLVTDMPSTSKATEEFVRSRVGPPRETFYGGMWDTAPRTDQINDTAYTYDALDPHTDTCYLMDSPGLQLFNCVAQDSGGGGRTRVVDAEMVVTILKTSRPDTFRFFCEKPLVFHHTEKGLFARVCAPVIALEFDGSVKQFRYNEYDLAPLDYMSESEMDAFYFHNAILVDVIKECEQSLKLKVGDMMILDNHRVMHGRTAFKGYRNLIGCYVGADDWIMRARSIFAEKYRHAGSSHAGIDDAHWKPFQA